MHLILLETNKSLVKIDIYGKLCNSTCFAKYPELTLIPRRSTHYAGFINDAAVLASIYDVSFTQWSVFACKGKNSSTPVAL